MELSSFTTCLCRTVFITSGSNNNSLIDCYFNHHRVDPEDLEEKRILDDIFGSSHKLKNAGLMSTEGIRNSRVDFGGSRIMMPVDDVIEEESIQNKKSYIATILWQGLGHNFYNAFEYNLDQ